MSTADYRSLVNQPTLHFRERLQALACILQQQKTHRLATAAGDSNNHIHTIFSFSPYSPSMAALKAFEAGLELAGSVDHDSIGAAQEMQEACNLAGIGTVSGCELRVDFSKNQTGNSWAFTKRKLNNPDKIGNAYITIQGIPSWARQDMNKFLLPIREARMKRSKAMTIKASCLLCEAKIGTIDFDTDVLCSSQYKQGGSITERHVLAAMAKKIIKKFGGGHPLINALERTFSMRIGGVIQQRILSATNEILVFDILGVLKSDVLPLIYIEPEQEECVSVFEAVTFSKSIGAIVVYPYLGDVTVSPTGDKKAEQFEDSYLEELLDCLLDIGFQAIAYMPPRNTMQQLLSLHVLCQERGFLQISGVDINNPRQSFNCPEMQLPEFKHLSTSNWALAAHEVFASLDARAGFFSSSNPLSALPLYERLERYAVAGKQAVAQSRQRDGEILSRLTV